jgi:hypothetical protein
MYETYSMFRASMRVAAMVWGFSLVAEVILKLILIYTLPFDTINVASVLTIQRHS